MKTEYEATFTNIKKEEMRYILKKSGATLIKKEFLQKRITFNPPSNLNLKKAWLRIRDEQDKITLSFKQVLGNKIEDQKEICLKINNFEEAELLLTTLGCKKKAYQENKREIWKLEDCEITIDEWPFLEPFLEIEGPSEKSVKIISKKLGFNYEKAIFGSIDLLYSKKYNISKDIVCNQTPKIVFNMKNPFMT